MRRLSLGLLLCACSSSSAGDAASLGDAGDGGNDGGNPACTFSVQGVPNGIVFGRGVVDSSETETVVIWNTSNCPLTMSPLIPQGPSASYFSVAIVGAIPPNGKVTFAITYWPPAPTYADVVAYLTFSFGPDASVVVELKG
jgi:hypothetical protein